MTSTTPGWAFAAATSRDVTRPRAMLLTATHGVEHARRVGDPRRSGRLPVVFSTPSRRVSGFPTLEPIRRWTGLLR